MKALPVGLAQPVGAIDSAGLVSAKPLITDLRSAKIVLLLLSTCTELITQNLGRNPLSSLYQTRYEFVNISARLLIPYPSIWETKE